MESGNKMCACVYVEEGVLVETGGGAGEQKGTSRWRSLFGSFILVSVSFFFTASVFTHIHVINEIGDAFICRYSLLSLSSFFFFRESIFFFSSSILFSFSFFLGDPKQLVFLLFFLSFSSFFLLCFAVEIFST